MKCTQCQEDKPASEFYKRSGRPGHFTECKTCFRTRINEDHERKKLVLVKEAGNMCQHCRYDRSPRVLTFHHLDPSIKSFGIAQRLSAPLDILRVEAAKCVLLCANCHSEKHLGLW